MSKNRESNPKRLHLTIKAHRMYVKETLVLYLCVQLHDSQYIYTYIHIFDN